MTTTNPMPACYVCGKPTASRGHSICYSCADRQEQGLQDGTYEDDDFIDEPAEQ